jgi:hypothetical protein
MNRDRLLREGRMSHAMNIAAILTTVVRFSLRREKDYRRENLLRQRNKDFVTSRKEAEKEGAVQSIDSKGLGGPTISTKAMTSHHEGHMTLTARKASHAGNTATLRR